MKKIVLLFVIISTILVSCSVVESLPFFGGEGSPTYKSNGRLLEKEIKQDAIAPRAHQTISTYSQVKDLSQINSVENYRLESFDANISSNGGSVSYTFYDPYNNQYCSRIGRKDIVGIRIIKDSVSCKVARYKLIQNIEGKRDPMSVVFLLDHSGSMGDVRADILQEAIDSTINFKHMNDEISIIKFDSEIKKIITSKNKMDLQSTLRPTVGLRDFGTTTSIQDAIQAAIEIAGKSKLKNKLVVLITDGCENSSRFATDLYSLITEAKLRRVTVNTIGFGKYVNQGYLNFISEETGGYFSQIFSRDEIRHIFNHTMFKVNNNFKISFSPCMFGDSLKLETKVKFKDSVFTNERLIYSSFSLGESIELNVLFDVNRYKIKEEYYPELKNFIDFLKDYPNISVEIAGHTDSDGAEKSNMLLSTNRAKAIKNYLVKKGISTDRISTIGYGETTPKYSNDSDENKSLNRRIEAKIIGQ